MKGVFRAQSAEIRRGFTAPTTTDLFKLMHPEDAPSVPTMTAHLEANWEKGVIKIIANGGESGEKL